MPNSLSIYLKSPPKYKYYKNRYHKGRILENITDITLRSLKEEGILKDYIRNWINGIGSDFIIFLSNGIEIPIECKNWTNTRVRPGLVKKEILSRFNDDGYSRNEFKILIGMFKYLNNSSRKTLEDNNILTINLGNINEEYMFKPGIRNKIKKRLYKELKYIIRLISNLSMKNSIIKNNCIYPLGYYIVNGIAYDGVMFGIVDDDKKVLYGGWNKDYGVYRRLLYGEWMRGHILNFKVMKKHRSKHLYGCLLCILPIIKELKHAILQFISLKVKKEHHKLGVLDNTNAVLGVMPLSLFNYLRSILEEHLGFHNQHYRVNLSFKPYTIDKTTLTTLPLRESYSMNILNFNKTIKAEMRIKPSLASILNLDYRLFNGKIIDPLKDKTVKHLPYLIHRSLNLSYLHNNTIVEHKNSQKLRISRQS